MNGQLVEKWGDIVREMFNYDAIVQGCNCFCTMGAGIAGQLAGKYPIVLYKDRRIQGKSIDKLGNICKVVIKDGRKTGRVINAYTQYRSGRDISYAALEMCLRKINGNFKGKKIALPMIGAGIAGGDWLRIRKMINTILVDCDVTIIYWKGDYEKIKAFSPALIQYIS